MVITAVIFDLDHTLAVADRDREALLREATEAVEAPPLSRERYLEIHRRSHHHATREPIFAKLLEEHDSAIDPKELAEAYRRTIAESLSPVSGAEALIRSLRDRYRVGLLTNGPVEAQREKLELLGWESLFDAVVITGSIEAGKPAASAFERILDELDTAAEEAVYVGDEVEMDVDGARDAGLRAIQVIYDGGPPPSDRATATVHRDELRHELPAVLGRLEDAERAEQSGP